MSTHFAAEAPANLESINGCVTSQGSKIRKCNIVTYLSCVVFQGLLKVNRARNVWVELIAVTVGVERTYYFRFRFVAQQKRDRAHNQPR